MVRGQDISRPPAKIDAGVIRISDPLPIIPAIRMDAPLRVKRAFSAWRRVRSFCPPAERSPDDGRRGPSACGRAGSAPGSRCASGTARRWTRWCPCPRRWPRRSWRCRPGRRRNFRCMVVRILRSTSSSPMESTSIMSRAYRASGPVIISRPRTST